MYLLISEIISDMVFIHKGMTVMYTIKDFIVGSYKRVLYNKPLIKDTLDLTSG